MHNFLPNSKIREMWCDIRNSMTEEELFEVMREIPRLRPNIARLLMCSPNRRVLNWIIKYVPKAAKAAKKQLCKLNEIASLSVHDS